MAELKYSGVNKGEDNRYKINNNILRMMNTNPALGTGYIIGSMLGENYWGKKRAKREQIADRKGRGEDNSIGADEKGAYGVGNTDTKKEPGYYDSMNKAFNEYKKDNFDGVYIDTAKGIYPNTSPGRVYIDTAKGIYPQTPQQANKPAVTTENAGNGGGVPTPADHWNNIMNASTYNPGSTGMYTNGARNLGNVIGADANGVYGVNSAPVIGADANGVYGVPNGGSAPSVANIPRSPQTKAPNPNPTPIPYTPEQLAQIQAYGKFTPEELKRMGAGELVAPPVQAVAPASSGGVLTAVANNVARGYVPEEEAAAMDRRTMFVPEEEAGLAEGYRVANNMSRAAATPATATDYNSRFVTPGHNDSLTWNAIFGNSTYNDPAAQARAAEYLKNMPG